MTQSLLNDDVILLNKRVSIEAYIPYHTEAVHQRYFER